MSKRRRVSESNDGEAKDEKPKHNMFYRMLYRTLDRYPTNEGKLMSYRRRMLCKLRRGDELTRKEFEYLVKIEKYDVLDSFLSDMCLNIFSKKNKFTHNELVQILVSKSYGDKSDFEKRLEEEGNYDDINSVEYNICFRGKYICKEIILEILKFLHSSEALNTFGLTCKSAYLCICREWNEMVFVTKENLYKIPQIVIRNLKFLSIHSPLPKDQLEYVFQAMELTKLRILDFRQGNLDITRSSSRNTRYLKFLYKNRLILPSVTTLRLTYGVGEVLEEKTITDWNIGTTFPRLRTLDFPSPMSIADIFVTQWKNVEHFHHGMNHTEFKSFLESMENSQLLKTENRCHELKSVIRTTSRLQRTSYEIKYSKGRTYDPVTGFLIPQEEKEGDRQISQENLDGMIRVFPNMEIVNVRTRENGDYEKIDELRKLKSLTIGNTNEEGDIKKIPLPHSNVSFLRMEKIRFGTFFNLDGGMIQSLLLWPNLREFVLNCASREGNKEYFTWRTVNPQNIYIIPYEKVTNITLMCLKSLSKFMKMTWFPLSLEKFTIQPIRDVFVRFRRNEYLKFTFQEGQDDDGSSYFHCTHDNRGRSLEYLKNKVNERGEYYCERVKELEMKKYFLFKWMMQKSCLEKLRENLLVNDDPNDNDEDDDDDDDKKLFRKVEIFLLSSKSGVYVESLVMLLEEMNELLQAEDDYKDFEGKCWYRFSLKQ